MNPQTEVQSRPGARVFRGRTLEALLPRIREELGEDAVVVGQRDCLSGGFAGFFQHTTVEVAARPAGAPEPAPADLDGPVGAPLEAPAAPFAVPGLAVDVRIGDEPVAVSSTALALSGGGEPALPRADLVLGAEDEARRAHAIHELLVRAASPFADELRAAVAPAVAEPLAVAVAGAGGAPRPAAADGIVGRLEASGLPPALAADVVAEAVTHGLPFGTPRQVRRLTRDALARRIPVVSGFPGRQRTIAIVGAGGAGKTLAVARLAAAYATGSDLPVRVLALGSTAGLVAQLAPFGVAVGPLGPERSAPLPPAAGLTLVDTPAVSPGDAAAVAALAGRLAIVVPDEVHVALPATLSVAAATELLDALAPLGPSRLLLTHLDATTHVGVALGVAVQRRTPISFVSRGPDLPGGLAPADARELASGALA